MKVNTKKATLRDFLDKVIHGRNDDMDIGEVIVEEGGRSEITFNVMVIILYYCFVKSNFFINRIIYDVEYDDNLDATFEQLQITDGKLVSVKPDDDIDEQNSSIFAISHRYYIFFP